MPFNYEISRQTTYKQLSLWAFEIKEFRTQKRNDRKLMPVSPSVILIMK